MTWTLTDAQWSELLARMTKVESDGASILSQTALIKLLLADALQTEPPACIYGASASPLAGETVAQAVAREAAALGPLGIVRVYDNGGGLPKAWATAQACGAPAQPCLLSWKRPPAEVLAGKWDAIDGAALAAIPAGQRVCYAHEMDSHASKGEYTAADVVAAWQHYVDLGRSVGCEATWTLILTGFQLEQRLPVFWPGDGYCAEVAVDPYGAAGQTAEQIIGPMCDLVTARGVGFGVAETGIDTSAGVPAVVAWVESLAWLTDKAVFCSYFDFSESGIPFRISTIPEAAAAYAALHDDL